MEITSSSPSVYENLPRETKIGGYRWVVVSLLLFSTTLNYMDRQVISYLKEFFCSPLEKGGFGWTNTDYAFVTSAFTFVYASFTIVAGWIIDKIGTKLGLALSLITWSVFGMLNALAGTTVFLHVLIRSLFGIGEAANFPASIKTVAEWFPKKERALATGIFNSGCNLGAMISALFVPWCMVYFGKEIGWKYAFLITGAVGFLWLIFWFTGYNIPLKSRSLGREEFQYIHSDDSMLSQEEKDQPMKVSWVKLFRHRPTWAFFWGKFLTDGIWWFLLFWLPDYLRKQFGMTGTDVMVPTFIVYGMAIFGSIFGGSLPMFLINKGMDVFKARMRSMFIIALLPFSLFFIQYLANKAYFGNSAVFLAVGVICLGAAAHQAWSANIFTTVSDMFPKAAVGSVIGIGSMSGGLGGVIMQQIAGHLTDLFKASPEIAYSIMFTICSVAYILAWTLMKILVPRFKQLVFIP